MGKRQKPHIVTRTDPGHPESKRSMEHGIISAMKRDGSIGADSMISSGTKTFKEAYVFKKKGSYFYYVGKKQKHGVFFIDGKLYRFKKKIGMTQDAYDEVQELIKEGSSWKELRALIGKPRHKKEADSCYAPDGTDYIYEYRHIRVTTFRPDEGEEIVIDVDQA